MLLLAAAGAVLFSSPAVATLGLLAGVILLAFDRRGRDDGLPLGVGGKAGLAISAAVCAAASLAVGQPAPASQALSEPASRATPLPTQIEQVSVTVPGPTATAVAVVPPAAPAAPTTAPEAALRPQGCTFGARFSALRFHLGQDWVGDCLEHEQVVTNGDAVQKTANGMLAWRQASSSAAFSDGQHTWLAGPSGVKKRLNNERLAWELAGAGPILPSHRIVTYYGNPLSNGMGILGEAPPDEMLWYLQQEIRAYATADPRRPVIGALELVAIVAQAQPGADGLYRLRMEPAVIERVAQWAETNGYLLILDVQPGRGSLAAEVESLLPYLRRPYVHLALDPEFAMGPNQRPGEALGSLDAAAVNGTIQTLSELVEREQLPPKLLVVHRFTERMLTNHQQIKPSPNVQVVITMDGFGAPEAKLSKYQELVRDQPVQFAGFKLFYKHDRPFLQAPRVIDLDPSPDLIIYQ